MRLPATPTKLAERDFRDGAHGFGVWALGLVLGGVIAVSGVSGAVKTAVQATAAIAGASAGCNVQSGSREPGGSSSMTPTDYAVDRLMARRVPAPAAAPAAG